MNLEQQVCSLELAKRLKELGAKQESVTYWMDGDLYFPGNLGILQKRTDREVVAAFTVAELEKMVPQEINLPFKNGKKRSHNHWRVIGKPRPNGYAARYIGGNSITNFEARGDTFADSLAAMLVYLIENKLITLP
jgi:hypothetical protein